MSGSRTVPARCTKSLPAGAMPLPLLLKGGFGETHGLGYRAYNFFLF